MAKRSYSLLFVEDKQSEIDRFRDYVTEFQAENNENPVFDILIAKNQEEATELIYSQRIDCGVIDLIIPRTGAPQSPAREARGEDLVADILKAFPVPFVIHSARPEDFDGSKIQGIPVKIINKDLDSHRRILEWLKQHTPLMDVLRSTLESLKREAAAIFYKNVWPNWLERSEDNIEVSKTVATRQITAHIGEVLSFSEVNSPDYHFDEVYFRPPVREDKLFTGDIFTIDKTTFVIITRPCDMSREEYPEYFLIVECTAISDWNKLNKKTLAKRREDLKKYSSQNVGPSKHFLPPCGDNHGPWLVDFKRVSSLKSSDAAKILEGRLASISPRFLPNLLQRAFAWLSGVGQPDLDIDVLLNLFSRK